jgi:hypothetical protein
VKNLLKIGYCMGMGNLHGSRVQVPPGYGYGSGVLVPVPLPVPLPQVSMKMGHADNIF